MSVIVGSMKNNKEWSTMNSEEIYYQLQYYNDRLTEQLNGTAEVKLTRSQLGNLANKVDNLYIKYQKQLSQEEKYQKINENGIVIILIVYIAVLIIDIIFALVYFI